MTDTSRDRSPERAAPEPSRSSPRHFVDELPDLIDPSEYANHPEGRLVRVRITVGEDGVHLLGDALRPRLLDAMLDHFGDGPIEQMLCG